MWLTDEQQVIKMSYRPLGWLRSEGRRGGQDCDCPQPVIINDRKEVFGMAWQGLLAKAVPTVVTGVVGAAAYEALVKAPWRKLTVSATALGLRAARTTERKTKEAAEKARLAAADVLAEAAERIGEQVPPPAAADSTPTVIHEADNACH